jgi:PAS domain S-box-containing protein
LGQENFFETILDNIPDMIFIKEAKDLKFIRFNKAGEDLIGYSRSDFIGKNDYDFFPTSQADFFISKDRSVFEGGKLVDIPEEPIETRFHGVRTLHTKKIPIYDIHGNPKFLVGISEDITDKKHTEEVKLKMYEEQVARIEAEKSLKARDEFISIASHELKSPISSLKLQAQMFKRRTQKGSPDAYSPEKLIS